MKPYGYIRNGKLYPGTPPTPAQPSSQYKSGEHDKQRREHSADILQPYNPDGSINPEFEWVYPEESKIYKEGGR